MPWNEVELLMQRKELIEAMLLPGANVSDLCKARNISRKTAYKWLDRYKANEGLDSLEDQSRARIHQPGKTPDDIEQYVINAHKAYPYWGPRKLRNLLRNEHTQINWPSATTFSRILDRNGCQVIKNNKSNPAAKRFERPCPNDLWQMDFKGSFMLDTHRCYPLTILDDHSRYSICLNACKDERTVTVKSLLIKAFKQFGLPSQINVDNGNPWGNSDLDSYTQLAVWLIKHDVRLSHSAPYHPQTNGKGERFHRTLKLELLHKKKYKNQLEIQTVFAEWQHCYNYVRPHDALQGLPPCSRYQISSRHYTDQPRQYDYESEDVVRKVDSNAGLFRFKGKRFRAGKGLAGEYIAIKETNESDVFSVFFMDTFIKKFKWEAGL